MRKAIIATALAGAVALPACTPTGNEDLVAGALIGTAVGAITADALTGNPNWVIVGALGGAAAGTLIAQNRRNNQCAYARGDGTYYTARCR